MKLSKKIWGAAFAAGPSVWNSECAQNGTATIEGLECLFSNLLSVATTLAGLAFGVMLIVGGFKFILAGGEKQGLESAQKTLTFAIIGLVLTIVAWFVLLLVRHFTGVDVTRFEIM